MTAPDLGPFAGLVGTVGSLVAMAGAIALTWRGRAKWEPSETDVPKGAERVGGAVTAALVGLLWVITRPADSQGFVPGLVVAMVVLVIVALLFYGFITATQTYNDLAHNQKIIGGFNLTRRARKALEDDDTLTVQRYLAGVEYDPDVVWTRASRALAKLVFVAGYLALIIAGALALASVAILVDGL